MSLPRLPRLGPRPIRREDFSHTEFFRMLERTVAIRDTTWAQLSDATGVSTTTLARMRDGRRCDAASLVALSNWAGIDPLQCGKVKR